MRSLSSLWNRAPGDGDKSPLFLTGGPRAVLCLHGFTGTPFEVRPLAEALAGHGFTVLAPLLAGHGNSVEDLARTSWPDWLASAEQALDRLVKAAGGAPVAVAGFSMGGLLALRLARLHPQKVAALLVMAAPLRMRPYQVQGIRWLRRLPAILKRGPLAALPKLSGYDVVDEDMKRANPGLMAMPVEGVASLFSLGEVVRADLPFIKTPILVAHGGLDRTVPFEDSLELAGSVASDVVERLWLRRSGHLIALDVERSTLIETASRFLSTYLQTEMSA